jgi:hypothetical protein
VVAGSALAFDREAVELGLPMGGLGVRGAQMLRVRP